MALTLLAANNAQTVLAAGINSSATSMTVNTGTGALFPSPVSGTSFFKLTLVDAATGLITEIVHVTARSGDTMTINRGQEGTTARAWSANDIAANMMTAGTLSYLFLNLQPMDATLTALSVLSTGANKLPYFTGVDTAAQTDFTSVGRDIVGKGSIASLLSYLGLGTAATKNIGTGSGQVPDMNSFTKGTGWQKLPGGKILQWFQVTTNTSAAVQSSYPIPFPIGANMVISSAVDVDAPNWTSAANFNASSCLVSAYDGNRVRAATSVFVFAIGE